MVDSRAVVDLATPPFPTLPLTILPPVPAHRLPVTISPPLGPRDVTVPMTYVLVPLRITDGVRVSTARPNLLAVQREERGE